MKVSDDELKVLSRQFGRADKCYLESGLWQLSKQFDAASAAAKIADDMMKAREERNER